MSTIKLRDDMIENYGIEKHRKKVKLSTYTHPKDKNIELLQDLVDGGMTSEEQHSGHNESQVIIEKENSSNGSYPQKNVCQIPSEVTTSEERYSTKNGISIPSFQIVTHAESLKRNGSRVLNKVNISDGDSNKNGRQMPSVEDVGSAKDFKNGLDVYHGQKTGAEDVSNNGEGEIKDKIPMRKHQEDISMEEQEKASDSFSVSSTSTLLSSSFILKDALDNRNAVIRRQNKIIENQNAIIEYLNSQIKNLSEVIKDRDAVMKNLNKVLKNQDVLIETQNVIVKNQDVVIENQDVVIKLQDV